MKGDDRKDVATFTAALQEAQATITADGIDVADIRVVVDHDSEPDYDGDRITPKLVMTGQRPASRDEVEAENARLEKQRLARKAEEAAWLRKRLADVEGR